MLNFFVRHMHLVDRVSSCSTGDKKCCHCSTLCIFPWRTALPATTMHNSLPSDVLQALAGALQSSPAQKEVEKVKLRERDKSKVKQQGIAVEH